jgi:superfamily II DNA or RNA helicase
LSLLRDTGITAELRDERQQGRPIGTRFLGELTPEQDRAVAALLRYETGVLAATTAFGKTVVAAKMIAARDRNTLVLVHRRQLLDQWQWTASVQLSCFVAVGEKWQSPQSHSPVRRFPWGGGTMLKCVPSSYCSG